MRKNSETLSLVAAILCLVLSVPAILSFFQVGSANLWIGVQTLLACCLPVGLYFFYDSAERSGKSTPVKKPMVPSYNEILHEIEANRLKWLEELAGGVAHEINNPLAVIQISATQLEKVLGNMSSKSPQLTRYIDSIQRNVKRVSEVVSALRLLSHDGARDPFVPNSAKALVRDAVNLLAARFRAGGVNLEQKGLSEDISFECRASQMVQVLYHLLNNALEAVAGRENAVVTIEVVEKDNRVAINVHNNGPIIPSELNSKIMLPFFTTKGDQKALGVGLSISTGIAEEHGGTLSFTSKEQDTCFVVEIPKAQANRPPNDPTPGTSAKSQYHPAA